ncbi:MAG: O-antigen ligase family protein [Burkholderiaceae bacterium]|jgi:O-antigen ligase|nr:O-antigen ligase family protein [Burkholderiaceae bacterium]
MSFDKSKLPGYITTLAAALVPALALWLRSGYSYGAGLMVLGALCFLPRWVGRRQSPGTWLLAVLFVAMAVMWYFLSALDGGTGVFDRPMKFILGAVSLLFAMCYPPTARIFFWGIPIGSAGAGGMALWQVCVQGMERATGYTNAIQWGNMALLLACFSCIYAAFYWRDRSWLWRLLVLAAAALGALASLLSGSRGGWLALVPVLPMLMVLVRMHRPAYFGRLLAGCAFLLVALAVVVAFIPRISERVDEVYRDVNTYLTAGNSNTSLGTRLEQYRLAGQMISEKPWLGWGMRGYVDEMHRRVDAGAYGPSIREYNFIHNDFLDIWVKLGIPGVLLQAALFISLLLLFWPSRQRMALWAPGSTAWREAMLLRVMGSLMPAMYLAFGMSQQFFVHNSGIVFFVFLVVGLWSALNGLERAAGAPR